MRGTRIVDKASERTRGMKIYISTMYFSGGRCSSIESDCVLDNEDKNES